MGGFPKLLLAFIVLVVVVVVGAALLAKSEAKKTRITPARFDKVTNGMTKDQVRTTLAKKATGAKLPGNEPRKPANADCDYYLSTKSLRTTFRICYVGGQVALKSAYGGS